MFDAAKRFMMTRPVAPIACAILLLTACNQRLDQAANANASPTPQKCYDVATGREVSCELLRRALDRELNGEPQDSVEMRLMVRQKVAEFLSAGHPNWQVEGIAVTRDEGDSGYYANVDVVADGKPKVITLRVWQFIKSDGTTYWKVTPYE
ncbi:MAG TPA: hypothetical protein VE863_14355 [Pyrinomonadaceae bacterium]|jgi:hypothetical protein|nr:hypothetical protein [Pyrinomonadaceae bacterium]